MRKNVLICCGTGCRANGSMAVVDAIQQAIRKTGAEADTIAQVKTTGCNGFCENGPIVKVMPDNITYYKVKPKDAQEIVEKTVVEGEPVSRLLYKNEAGERVLAQEENPFYAQ